MAIYQFLTYVKPANNNWQKVNLDIEELAKTIDSILTRASWTEGLWWKSENESYDHDVIIDYDQERGFIEEFQFRTDLTDKSYCFLNEMLNLCKANKWVLVDIKGNMCNPNLKDLASLIHDSDPQKYLNNPIEFLENK